MKKYFRILTSTAAASLLALTALAQENTNQTGASGEFSRSASTNSGSARPLYSTAKDSDPALYSGRTNQTLNFGTNAVTDANNSARNVRDRNNQTLTPGDQGNSSADVATTRQIRKEITSTKDMSVSARNIKIITLNGRVTLRGPVKTEQERQMIGEVASKFAQSTNVDNQLEVKLTPTGRN